MKKIYSNNRLAKILLTFSDCHTIMFFGFVLSKLVSDLISKDTENHEFIHVVQYWVCFTIGVILALPMVYFFSWWFVLLPIFLYYILYVGEVAISFVHHYFNKRKRDASDVRAPAGLTPSPMPIMKLRSRMLSEIRCGFPEI